MTLFHSVSYWRQYHGSCRAILIENPRGKNVLLRKTDPAPLGVWRLKGVIE